MDYISEEKYEDMHKILKEYLPVIDYDKIKINILIDNLKKDN
jgi:hypothetical protein